MQEQPSLEQLDWCFFTTVEWTSTFPNTLVKPLAKLVPDHTPCVISIETTIPKCRLFRFENYWPLHPGFREAVQNSWNATVRAANNALVLSAKLKRLRRDLKFWSLIDCKNGFFALFIVTNMVLSRVAPSRTVSHGRMNFYTNATPQVLNLLSLKLISKRPSIR
jgi:hypothetical protein